MDTVSTNDHDDDGGGDEENEESFAEAYSSWLNPKPGTKIFDDDDDTSLPVYRIVHKLLDKRDVIFVDNLKKLGIVDNKPLQRLFFWFYCMDTFKWNSYVFRDLKFTERQLTLWKKIFGELLVIDPFTTDAYFKKDFQNNITCRGGFSRAWQKCVAKQVDPNYTKVLENIFEMIQKDLIFTSASSWRNPLLVDFSEKFYTRTVFMDWITKPFEKSITWGGVNEYVAKFVHQYFSSKSRKESMLLFPLFDVDQNWVDFQTRNYAETPTRDSFNVFTFLLKGMLEQNTEIIEETHLRKLKMLFLDYPENEKKGDPNFIWWSNFIIFDEKVMKYIVRYSTACLSLKWYEQYFDMILNYSEYLKELKEFPIKHIQEKIMKITEEEMEYYTNAISNLKPLIMDHWESYRDLLYLKITRLIDIAIEKQWGITWDRWNDEIRCLDDLGKFATIVAKTLPLKVTILDDKEYLKVGTIREKNMGNM
jgi:hypothetical protein